MEPWIETVHLNPPRQWNHVESFGQTKLKRFHDQYQKGCFQHIGCLRKRKKHCCAKCWCPTETMKKVLDLLDLRSNRGVLYRTQRILSKLSCRQVVWHACTWIQRLQIAFKLSTCELLPVFFSSPSRKKNLSTATYGYALLYLCIQIIQGEDLTHVTHFATEASAPVVRSHRRQMHVLEPRREANNGI